MLSLLCITHPKRQMSVGCWSLYCSHRHATQVSKEEIKEQLSRISFNLPPAQLKCQTHFGVSGWHDNPWQWCIWNNVREDLQVRITKKQTTSTVWFAWQQRTKLLLRIMPDNFVAQVTWQLQTGASESYWDTTELVFWQSAGAAVVFMTLTQALNNSGNDLSISYFVLLYNSTSQHFKGTILYFIPPCLYVDNSC